MKTVTRQTLSIFVRHAKPYRALFLGMLAATGAGVAIETVIPLFYKRFFDTIAGGAAQGDAVAALTRIIVFILGLYAIEWVLWRFITFANNFFQPRIMADLLQTCFDYLQGHAYGFFINRFVGALVRKVSRLIDAFEDISDRLLWDLYPMVLRITFNLIVLFERHVMLGLLLLGWTLLYLVVNYLFTMYKMKYDVEAAEIDSTVTARLADTLTNNVNIKLFTGHRDELNAFKKLTERQFALRKFTWDLNAYMEAVQVGLMVVIEFVMFYFAIRYWQKGFLTVGDFVLIQAYLLGLFNRLWDFGRVVRHLYRRFADAEEMTTILHTPHAVQDKPRAKKLKIAQGAVTYRDVGFSYLARRKVFRDFNLAIRPGERVGLVGPSGGGKTTLVALLFRFYDVQEGGIYIDGQNIRDVTQESLRGNISLVPQDPILFHRTLMENIRYGKRNAADREVMRAARLAHCDEFIERLPEQYETFVGERGIKLSGGERQRVAIARAILKNAPILVLDEATSSLDSHSERLIQDALEKLMAGKTTIVIAHRLSTIMKMDRIVVVRGGSIEEEGSHGELVEKRGGLYKKLWSLQAGGFIVN